MKQIINLFITILAVVFVFNSCSEDEIKEADLQIVTQDFSEIGQNTAIAAGYITVDKNATIDKKGVCWSQSPNPTIDDDMRESSDEESLGMFTVQLFGLSPQTTYYARVYASSNGKIYYGNELTFKTKATPTDGWCVIDEINDITPTSAKVLMQIADDGNSTIQSYGVCYSLSNNPTTDDKVVSNIGGAGFEAMLADLEQNTTYYVRPYFIVESGIVYGEMVQFKTLNFLASTKVHPGYQSAYLFGEVIMNAGSETTEKGFCWGLSPEPNVENDKSVVAGKGQGIYEALIGGLTKGTTYYMRAYAKNDDGVFYGLPIEFTTKEGNILPGANLSDMIMVEHGTFQMGEPDTDIISSAIQSNTYGKEPVHTVKISRNFYINRFHITNEQMCTFLNVYQSTTRRDYANQALYNSSGRTYSFSVSGTSPNLVYTPVSGAARKPVGNITWGCAYNYCLWLSAELGIEVRLPSEAEWEFAARGGNLSKGYKYSGSNNRNDVAVLTSTTGPKEVGSLAPNELGIYDMSGNMFEYCQDQFDMDFYLGLVGKETVDPLKTGAANGSKVIRGGSWRHESYFRVSARGSCSHEADCGNHSSMRIVMEKLPSGL